MHITFDLLCSYATGSPHMFSTSMSSLHPVCGTFCNLLQVTNMCYEKMSVCVVIPVACRKIGSVSVPVLGTSVSGSNCLRLRSDRLFSPAESLETSGQQGNGHKTLNVICGGDRMVCSSLQDAGPVEENERHCKTVRHGWMHLLMVSLSLPPTLLTRNFICVWEPLRNAGRLDMRNTILSHAPMVR